MLFVQLNGPQKITTKSHLYLCTVRTNQCFESRGALGFNLKGVVETFLYRLTSVCMSYSKAQKTTFTFNGKSTQNNANHFEDRFIVHQCKPQTTLFYENRRKFTVKNENETAWLVARRTLANIADKTCATMLRAAQLLLTQSTDLNFIIILFFSFL